MFLTIGRSVSARNIRSPDRPNIQSPNTWNVCVIPSGPGSEKPALVIRDLNLGSRAERFVYFRSRGGSLSLARSFHLGLLVNFTPTHGVTVTVL